MRIRIEIDQQLLRRATRLINRNKNLFRRLA
jgi:hypothetical protein